MAKSALWIMVGFFVTLMISLHSSHALPFYPPAAAYNNNRHKDYLVEIENPDEVLELLAKLGQSILRAHEGSNTKRGLDLGLGRGFSGSQAAKHLMGLAAANFAAGPGKKKRVLGNNDLSYGMQDMNMMDNSNSNEWSQSNKE